MPIMHAHTGLCTVNRPPMLWPSQGMIQRLKCDLVHVLSLSNSFTVMPAGESMMELLRVAVARIVVGEGGGGGGVVV